MRGAPNRDSAGSILADQISDLAGDDWPSRLVFLWGTVLTWALSIPFIIEIVPRENLEMSEWTGSILL
jgi:hypothetical protein